MPYKPHETPSGTEKVPPHGQAIYRGAFNAAYGKYGEERAHAIAWSAVKMKYRKKGDQWIVKDWDFGELFDFDPDQPRDPQGRWTSGGAGSTGSSGAGSGGEEGMHEVSREQVNAGNPNHPGEGYSKEAYVGRDGIIHTGNVDDAARALHEGRKVELQQPDQVATLLDRLGAIAKDAIDKGEKAPNFDLCNVSVAGTNLFCAESKGIPRVEMPQLADDGKPGDAGDFVRWLQNRGYGVTDDQEYAAHLRATQNELKGSQVALQARFLETGEGKFGYDPEGAARLMERPLVISRDNYILDGHHSWAARVGIDARDNVLADDRKMNVRRVDTDIINLLYAAEDFTGGKGHKSAKDRKGRAMRDWSEESRAAALEARQRNRKEKEKRGKASEWAGGYRVKTPGWARAHVQAYSHGSKWGSHGGHGGEYGDAIVMDARCPDCGGTGGIDGAQCSTCGGTGYDDDDDFDDAARVTFSDALVLEDGVRRTRDGYLVASARVSRTGVQTYGREELGVPGDGEVLVYRPADEVFNHRSLKSLAHKPVTLTHPPEMVDSGNWRQYAVGYTGDEVSRDGDTVRIPMVIMDGAAIKAFESGVRELSVGYSTELKWEKGTTPEGETYDAIQTRIRGNHLAVVPAARGGSRLVIGDSREGETNMGIRVLMDGRTVEFADEAAASYVQTLVANLNRSLADARSAAAAAEEEQEEEKKTRAERDALKGEAAALKQQIADFEKKIGDDVIEKIDLLMKANAALGGKGSFDARTPSVDIRRAVVLAKMGNAGKALTDAEMIGAFKVVTADTAVRSGTDRLADNLGVLQFGGGGSAADELKAMKDKAYEERNAALRDAWKTPQRA